MLILILIILICQLDNIFKNLIWTGYNYEYNNDGKNDNNRNNGISIKGNPLVLNNENGIALPLSKFYTDKSDIYNNGNFWTYRLSNKEVTFNIPILWNINDQQTLLNSLTSINAENLSLVGLLSYYFSHQDKHYIYTKDKQWEYQNNNNVMPIGLWARPHRYTISNEQFTEQTSFSTFLCSDRYNWFIRNNKSINSLSYDRGAGNKGKVSLTVSKQYLANYGSTIFYFDRTFAETMNSSNLINSYSKALVRPF